MFVRRQCFIGVWTVKKVAETALNERFLSISAHQCICRGFSLKYIEVILVDFDWVCLVKNT